MKKAILILATCTLLFSLSSCDEIKDEISDALSISFNDVKIEKTLDISNPMDKSTSIEGDADGYTFNDSTTFSLSDANSDSNFEEKLQQYLGSLSLVKVKTIEFLIVDNLTEGQTLTINELTITILKGDAEQYSQSFSDITPDEPIDASGINEEVLGAISASLVDNEDLTFKASGKVTGDVQNFEILATIISDIEADPLDVLN